MILVAKRTDRASLRLIVAPILWVVFYIASAQAEVALTPGRGRFYLAAPPSGVLGARLLVSEAQTD